MRQVIGGGGGDGVDARGERDESKVGAEENGKRAAGRVRMGENTRRPQDE